MILAKTLLYGSKTVLELCHGGVAQWGFRSTGTALDIVVTAFTHEKKMESILRISLIYLRSIVRHAIAAEKEVSRCAATKSVAQSNNNGTTPNAMSVEAEKQTD